MIDQSDVETQHQLFAVMVLKHLDGLYRTAFRMTQSYTVTEDIVQGTCLRASAIFARRRPNNSFKVLLFHILTHLCIDYCRQQTARSITPLDATSVDGNTLMQEDSQKGNSEGHALYCAKQKAPITAIADLAPELRAVVLLILAEGMSYDEAAECMDLPVDTIRLKLHRARKQLQKSLQFLIVETTTDRKPDDRVS